MDTLVIKQGLVEVKSFFKKSKNKWLQLHKPDSIGPARLVMFDSKQQSENKDIEGVLLTCIKDITKVIAKPDDNTVVLQRNNKHTKEFWCKNSESAADWQRLINYVMAVYSVLREGVYPVHLMSSMMLSVSGECTAIISSGLLKLIDGAEKTIAQWPLTVVRRFFARAKYQMVIIELGRLSSTGEGSFALRSIYWKKIISCLDQCTQKIREYLSRGEYGLYMKIAPDTEPMQEPHTIRAMCIVDRSNEQKTDRLEVSMPVSRSCRINRHTGISSCIEQKTDRLEVSMPVSRSCRINQHTGISSCIEFSSDVPITSQPAENGHNKEKLIDLQHCDDTNHYYDMNRMANLLEDSELSPNDLDNSQSAENEEHSHEQLPLQVKCLNRKIWEEFDDDDDDDIDDYENESGISYWHSDSELHLYSNEVPKRHSTMLTGVHTGICEFPGKTRSQTMSCFEKPSHLRCSKNSTKGQFEEYQVMAKQPELKSASFVT